MLRPCQFRCLAAAFALTSLLLVPVSGFQAHDVISSPLRPTTLTRQLASNDDDGETTKPKTKKGKGETFGSQLRRSFLASSAAALTYAAVGPLGFITPPGYERVSPLQFIAALGDPEANSGNGAEGWLLWETDPGPRGFRQNKYEKVVSGELQAPQWFQEEDFWLDENAIVMPPP